MNTTKSVVRDENETLCHTCTRSQIMRKKNGNNDVVFCHSLTRVVIGVEKCSSYSERGQMDWYQLNAVAWHIRLDRGRVEFIHPDDVDDAARRKINRPGFINESDY